MQAVSVNQLLAVRACQLAAVGHAESAAELVSRPAVARSLGEENAFWPGDQKRTVDVQPIGVRPVGNQALRAGAR